MFLNNYLQALSNIMYQNQVIYVCDTSNSHDYKIYKCIVFDLL